MDLVKREPSHVRHLKLELCLLFDLALNLFIQNFALLFVLAFGKSADDAITILSRHRKERDEHLARKTNVQRVMRKLPVDTRIGHVKETLKSAALKRESQTVSDRTTRTVAPD